MPKRYANLERHCPLARSLSVVGDAWTLLVLRDLFNDKRRFGEILESLEGISPNVLSTRLKKLEREGVIEAVLYSHHPPRSEYVLTQKGRDLAPILRAMRDWGRQHPLDSVE